MIIIDALFFRLSCFPWWHPALATERTTNQLLQNITTGINVNITKILFFATDALKFGRMTFL